MKVFTVRTSDDQAEFISTVIERLGAEVIQTDEALTEKGKKDKKKKGKTSSILNLFGTWKDVDIDPDTFSDKLWDRSLKF